MGLRRLFRRPKPVKRDDDPVVVAEGDSRPRGPRQEWSRRPPEPALAAVGAQSGPAWAPASWREEAEYPAATHETPSPPTHRRGRRAGAARTSRDDVLVVHTERDLVMAIHPASNPVSAEPEQDDVLTVAAREIDRMAEEIRSGASGDAELAVLQEHARRVEALTRANPFLRKLE